MNFLYKNLVLTGMIALASSVSACPFKITNDTLRGVLVNQGDLITFVKSGTTREIPGIAAEEATIHIEESALNGIFKMQYILQELECVQEGKPLPHIFVSRFAEMAEKGTVIGGLKLISLQSLCCD